MYRIPGRDEGDGFYAAVISSQALPLPLFQRLQSLRRGISLNARCSFSRFCANSLRGMDSEHLPFERFRQVLNTVGKVAAHAWVIAHAESGSSDG